LLRSRAREGVESYHELVSVYTPNFVKVGQCAAAQLLQFKHFKMAAVRHLEFCTKWILTIPWTMETHFT